MTVYFILHSSFLWYTFKVILTESLIHQPTNVCPNPYWRDHSQEILEQKAVQLFHMSVLLMAEKKTVKAVVTSCDLMFVLGFKEICKSHRRMLWGDIHRHIDMMIPWFCLILYEF